MPQAFPVVFRFFAKDVSYLGSTEAGLLLVLIVVLLLLNSFFSLIETALMESHRRDRKSVV